MPEIRFYNTLTHAVEPFEPVEPGHVYMYNCGPTVYDYAHIGNFKTFLFADVLRRFLELVGYQVHQVMNITDVGHMTEDQLADGGGEDKMAVAAKKIAEAKKAGAAHVQAIEDPNDPYQIAGFYTDAFLDDARKLGLKVADEYPSHMPKATEHVVNAMIPMIAKLIETGHAYVGNDGAVYYAVESFPEYGRLSGNTLDQLRGGAGGRISAENQAGKRHPADFLLWKPDASHIMKWDSPWGVGYPGWHIECSAMAKARLGRDQIDIHTGGEDNIFPHHECEIAQTCGATGNDRFARFWMHSRHLMVEGQKMSKSKGNFYTVRQILDGAMTERLVDPAVLRFEMIKANYRTQLNFTRRGLEDSAKAVRKLRNFAAWSKQLAKKQGLAKGDPPISQMRSHPAVVRFVESLSDDLNMSGALASVFEFINAANEDHDAAELRGVLRCFDSVMAVIAGEEYIAWQGETGGITAIGDPSEEVNAKCNAIDAARAAKDYAAADAIRAELIAAGYDVKTTKDGTVAMKKLA